MAFFLNGSVWMLLITWIIKQWFSEWHLRFFYHRTASLHIHEQEVDLTQKKLCRKAAHLCPVLSVGTNSHVPVNTRTRDDCLNIVGLSLSAICCNRRAASLLNNHFYVIKSPRQYGFVPRSEFICIHSASTCLIFYSYLLHYSFRKSFRRQKSLHIFHSHLFSSWWSFL